MYKRQHLLWAVVFALPLALSFLNGHHHTSMFAWSVASLIVCLLPVGMWLVERRTQAAAQTEISKRPEPTRVEKQRELVRAEGPEPARANRQRSKLARVDRKADPARAEKPEPAKPSSVEKEATPAKKATPAKRLAPARRDHLKPVPDAPREPARRDHLKPVANEPAEQSHGWPTDLERRKAHKVVRFERRSSASDAHRERAIERVAAEAAAAPEQQHERRKHHVVVHFDRRDPDRLPDEHHGPEQPELTWQVFDQVEA